MSLASELNAIFTGPAINAAQTATAIAGAITNNVSVGSTPADTVAALDGTAAAGTASEYSRADHKHADADRPSTGEKAALAGTSGTPGSGNKYVTNGDARNTDARTPLAHTHPESDVTSLVTDLAAKQGLDATLTALAALDSTAGLVEETAADTFTKRAIGVGASTSIPTRADADTRYAAASHSHAESDVTSLTSDLAAKQGLDATLTALAALDATAGLVEETGADTFTKRTIGVGASTSIPTRADADTRYAASSHSHPESDITSLTTDLAAKQTLDATLTALAALDSSTGLVEETAADTFTKRALGVAASTSVPTRADADARYQGLDATLTALAALDSTTGLVEETGADTFTKRAIGVGASTSIPTRADADTRYAAASHSHPESDVTSLATDLAAKQTLDATLTALAALDATAGLVEQTAADTFTKRSFGVGASTSVPTRADADTRYAAATHAHAESDVTSLVADLAAKEVAANKGAASGYASLDGSTKVPVAQLPTGATSSTVCLGSDARLSDVRTPTLLRPFLLMGA